MFSFSLTPSPIKDLKILQRLKAVKDVYQRKELAFRLKGIKFHYSLGIKTTVDQRGKCFRAVAKESN
ncbi:MAG: hypothetical protein N2327_08525 [Caldimicrobium sp.]|nr:hypothetical protein [Caldimicrobium sp.]